MGRDRGKSLHSRENASFLGGNLLLKALSRLRIRHRNQIRLKAPDLLFHLFQVSASTQGDDLKSIRILGDHLQGFGTVGACGTQNGKFLQSLYPPEGELLAPSAE